MDQVLKIRKFWKLNKSWKKKERAHDVMAKRLEIAEAISTFTVNELSEK